MNKLKFVIPFLLVFLYQCESNKQNNPLNISKEESIRIATLCKVFGGLKYFTINTNIDRIYWDEILIENITKYPEFYKNNAELNVVVKNLFGTLKQNNFPVLNDSIPENVEIFDWIKKDVLIEPKLKQELQKVLNTKHFVTNNIDFEVVNDLPVFKSNYGLESNQLPDLSLSMLGLFNYWNFINLFSPYKNTINGNWEDILEQFIPIILCSKNETSYQTNYMKLFAKLNDGHAFARCKYSESWNNNLYNNLIVSNNIIVDIIEPNNDLKIGDSLITINDLNIDSLSKNLKTLIPASNETYLNFRVQSYLFKNFTDSVFKFKFYRKNKLQNLLLNRSQLFTRKSEIVDDTTKWKILNKDIIYINCGNIEPKDLRSAFALMNNKDLKVILDLRKYPNHILVDSICYFLNDFVKPYVLLKSINPQLPGSFLNLDVYSTIASLPKLYNLKKCVVLVNEGTMSHGEFSAMAYATLPNTIIMGSQTAGADGNLNTVNLPNNLTTNFSGLGVYYPNGTPTQCVGIKVDIVLDKKDFITSAIEYLSK